MPLVIVVLIAIVGVLVYRSQCKDEQIEKANNAKNLRKTNAVMERDMLDHFMREGLTFDEAYEETLSEMYRRGFEPCIPKSAYGELGTCESSYVSHPERFDSVAVKDRKRLLELNHVEISDENVYTKLPATSLQRDIELQKIIMARQAIPVGSYFIYPGYGTVKVLEYVGCFYKIKVLKTGQVCTSIKIGDPNIRLMDDK